MEKYLKHDEEVKRLESWDELKEYLDFRKTHDEWIHSFINELSAIGIPNEPLFIPQYCTDIKVTHKGYTLDIGNIDYQNEENAECIADYGLFLAFPHKNRVQAYPTRRIAFSSICKRADDDGGTMLRLEPKTNKKLLPISEKAERLCRDYTLYSDACKILYRDGKISAVLSKEYAILPADEIVPVLETELQKEHPNLSFDRGLVSHEFLVAEYLLNDEEMEETFRLTLNDAGCDIASLKAGVRFSTSDVGKSKVYASLFYEADGIRTSLGSGIELEHKGEASVEKFKDACQNLGILFKECEDRIEELGNTPIRNISACILAITEAYGFFPKAISEEVADGYFGGGTAIDVYLALNDIVQRLNTQNNLTPTRYLDLCEQVARLMKLPYDKIDKGEEWMKI